MNESFAERLKRIRKEKKYTQKQLATMANISMHTISNYEQEVSDPTIYYLFELAKVLDITSEYLYLGDNNMTNYTNAIKNELIQLNSCDKIAEIKKQDFNATILSHLEMTDTLVYEVQDAWNTAKLFKKMVKLQIPTTENAKDTYVEVDSYCTKAYVQEVILKYCQNRAKFRAKFNISDGMLSANA